MSKPYMDEVTRLKRIRIQHLEVELQNTRDKVGTQEQIQFLKQSLDTPISNKIIERNGKEYTKEEFQNYITDRYFGLYDDGLRMYLDDWTIPSLDGLKFKPFFHRGFGPVTEPDGTSRASLSLSKCRIRTLGSVEFPPIMYELKIDNNDITDLQGVTFPRCSYIDLGNNFITSLHGCSFSEGTTQINLRNNFISKIEDLNVASLPMTLIRINLEGNPITDGFSPDEFEELSRKILYKIAKERNRIKRTSSIFVSPEPSAPPLDLDTSGHNLNGGSKKTKRKYHKVIMNTKKQMRIRISTNKRKK